MPKIPRASVSAALVSLVWLGGCMSASPALPSGASAAPSAPEACGDIDIRTPSGRGFSLTGRWRSPDGGTYYLRQAHSCVWFAGLSGDTGAPGGESASAWTNSFFGHLASDFTLRGEWADIPWGRDDGVGILDWRVNFADVDGEETITLQVIDVTGGFSGELLVQPETREDLVVSLQPSEDCLAVETADGADYQILSWPDGWDYTAPPGFLGPNGEQIRPGDSFAISGEVAHGEGFCGPGRLFFVDQMEVSTAP
jgi:hypothetical protein